MLRGPPGIERWVDIDPYLTLYQTQIRERFLRFNGFRKKLSPNKDLNYATKAYEYFGIHVDRATSVVTVREWAPGAKALYFAGDFNLWNRSSHKFTMLPDGIWELVLQPSVNGFCVLRHLSEVKIVVESWDGVKHDRLSPWATYVEQPLLETDTQYRQKMWCPPIDKIYKFRYPKPKRPRSLKIYEAHVGIATGGIDVGCEVGTYRSFSREILPRIKANGYNAVQLMAIMEHAYYASFGYQVTSFYAASSRYGSPEDLKQLIDKAHSMNIYVILDIIHSHASSNVNDGLNEFDGTQGCFFYDDSRGYHGQWGSRMFNTNSLMVLRFLISNACWFVDEYNFDGFRFDGITAMMYKSRGINQNFSGHYDEYFGDSVDPNGILYSQLINYFLHKQYPNMITIAEEVSGMPGTCRPLYEGGLGFDYRLAMGIPDKWISLLKHQSDETWDLGDLIWTHSNRRHREPHVAYCESHDQALVGDKTISFWLMDALMYWEMKRKRILNIVIDRGLALHKMIRLLTHTMGGEAYLNFIGNEFGHPEWLDFPREGNAWSYHYCRRQWKLVDDKALLYSNLNLFDQAMNITEEKYGWLAAREAYVSLQHQQDKIVVFDRAGLVFVFNFHVTKSFSAYRIGVDQPGEYQVVLCSDDTEFAGHGRVDAQIHHFTADIPYCNRKFSMEIYIPNRSATIFAKSEDVLIREKEYSDNLIKTVAEITMYARKSAPMILDKVQPTITEACQDNPGEGNKTGNNPHDNPATSSAANNPSVEPVAPTLPAAVRMMIINESSAMYDDTLEPNAPLDVEHQEPFVEQPPMGELVGGGETPLSSEAAVLYELGVELNESSSSTDSSSDHDSTLLVDSIEIMEPIEEVTEPADDDDVGSSTLSSGSAVPSLEAQFGSGSQAGSDTGLKSRSSGSLIGSGSESGYSVASQNAPIKLSSESSTSNYQTASSSRFDTAGSVSDIVKDMSVWGMSSTTTLSSDELLATIESFQSAEEPDEFLDAFEDLPDDE